MRDLIDVTLPDHLVSQQARIGNMLMDADFAAGSPLHAHVRTAFGLSTAEFDRVAANVKSTAATLRGSCRAGPLRFDADVDGLLRDGEPTDQEVDCDSTATR